MTIKKNGATAPTVNPTQQLSRSAKQNYSTLFLPSSQAIPGNTTPTGCTNPPADKPHLPPREQRCLDALIAHPAGIKSYDLRELTCCSYVPGVIQSLKSKGYEIDTTMEPDGFTAEGRPYSIGWYRLMGFAGEVNP